MYIAVSLQPSHFLSLLESSGIIDVVNSFRCTSTSYDVYKLVAVPNLALALPHHMTSELVPSVGPKLHLARVTTQYSSCALSVDEVRDRGRLNRESQYTSQGLLVTHSEVPLSLSSLYQVTE